MIYTLGYLNGKKLTLEYRRGWLILHSGEDERYFECAESIEEAKKQRYNIEHPLQKLNPYYTFSDRVYEMKVEIVNYIYKHLFTPKQQKSKLLYLALNDDITKMVFNTLLALL
jgi:hypothetical protein